MEEIHEKLGNLLLKGWTMLGNSCPQCMETPLMRSKDKKIYCGKCDIYLSHDMQSVEHDIKLDHRMDNEPIVNEDRPKMLEFKPYDNLMKITKISMNDDSIHRPNWDPDKYFTNKIDPKLKDTVICIISKRLEKYMDLLENTGCDSLVDIDK